MQAGEPAYILLRGCKSGSVMGVYIIIVVGAVALVAAALVFMRLERAQLKRMKRRRGETWRAGGDSVGGTWGIGWGGDGGGHGGCGGGHGGCGGGGHGG